MVHLAAASTLDWIVLLGYEMIRKTIKSEVKDSEVGVVVFTRQL